MNSAISEVELTCTQMWVISDSARIGPLPAFLGISPKVYIYDDQEFKQRILIPLQEMDVLDEVLLGMVLCFESGGDWIYFMSSYSRDFRDEVISSNESVSHIAAKYGVSPSVPSFWMFRFLVGVLFYGFLGYVLGC